MHIQHPALQPEAVLFRGYQANLARVAQKQDTLVVLPTGMGKTVVALLVVADALQAGARRILVLAPTRPLVEQHGRFLQATLAPPWKDQVAVLTGTVPAARRQDAYRGVGLVVATPQTIQNDLVSGRLGMDAFQWVVYDEAHRAMGDYPYTMIGRAAQQAGCRALGLTASPGHDVARIDDVRTALGLGHVEIRTPTDADVAEYVQPMRVDWEVLPLPPAAARVSKRLQEALQARVRSLRDMGFLKGTPGRPRRTDLLDLQRRLQKAVQGRPDADASIFQALSLQAQAMKLQHAIEQLETQGSGAFVQYMEGVRGEAAGSKPTKAARMLADDPLINEAYHIARMDDSDNPKMERAATLVLDQFDRDPASLVIVFAHYRVTCEALAERLSRHEGVRPVVFVGQGKRAGAAGMTQKQQAETVARFTAGQHNVLVATSVAEEGLDIPETDLVVFYEPIPSEIRSIQRRGRTGRKREGRVVVLMTKGTQDEAAHWTARRREAQMVQELHNLRARLQGRPVVLPGGQQTLGGGPGEAPGPAAASAASPGPAAAPVAQGNGEAPAAGALGPAIACDTREQPGGVVRALHEMGARLDVRQLEVADFVLSDRVAVERKSCKDFVDSLVDGRLFDQVRALKAYPRPLLVLEGESLHGHRQVAPEAVWGALSSIAVDFQVPVLRTQDALETARLLVATAKREQHREGRRVAIRSAGRSMGDHDLRLYILCGLPGVSDRLAGRLLAHFGSVAGVMTASRQDLAAVDGIGPAKAKDIRRILDMEDAAPPAVQARAETI